MTTNHSTTTGTGQPRSKRRRRRSSALAVVAVILAACLSDERAGSVDESIDRGEAPTDAPASAATCTLPPGGLVDTQINSGWTEGSFSVTDDGAATYNLPLWVPDGRSGLSPQLALSYNSRAGNGPIGVGWSLSGLSSITPCTPTPAQDGRIRRPV